MSSERDIVDICRELGDGTKNVHESVVSALVRASATISILRAEVRVWRQFDRTLHERHDGELYRSIRTTDSTGALGPSVTDATDAAGALGKEASDGK